MKVIRKQLYVLVDFLFKKEKILWSYYLMQESMFVQYMNIYVSFYFRKRVDEI